MFLGCFLALQLEEQRCAAGRAYITCERDKAESQFLTPLTPLLLSHLLIHLSPFHPSPSPHTSRTLSYPLPSSRTFSHQSHISLPLTHLPHSHPSPTLAPISHPLTHLPLSHPSPTLSPLSHPLRLSRPFPTISPISFSHTHLPPSQHPDLRSRRRSGQWGHMSRVWKRSSACSSRVSSD